MDSEGSTSVRGAAIDHLVCDSASDTRENEHANVCITPTECVSRFFQAANKSANLQDVSLTACRLIMLDFSWANLRCLTIAKTTISKRRLYEFMLHALV